MTTWLKIIMLCCFTFGIAIYGEYTISNDCRNVSQPLLQMEAALIAEDWEKAEQLFAEAQQLWQKPQLIWPLLIDHEDSRDIEISFVDLETALQLRQSNIARQELASLIYHIDHVHRQEQISWQNVL